MLPAFTSVSRASIPKTVSASSSLVKSTSTYSISSVMTSRAFSSDQSLRRKFRSQLTVSAVFLARNAGLPGDLGHAVGQGGSDAREVEPVLALENLVPVDFAGAQFGDRAAFAVVEEGGRPLGGAGLHEINAQAKAVLLHVVEVQPELAHVSQAGLAHGVVGNARRP